MIISLPANIETARVPELPEHTLLPGDGDMMLFWSSEDNKTRKISVSSLKQVFQPEGTSTYEPVSYGGDIIYIVPPDKDGQWSFSIPQVAGKNFKVRRDMMPLLPGVEFLSLSAGGVQVLDMPLQTGQRFELVIFEMSDGSIVGGGNGGGGINGKKLVNSNYNVVATDSGVIHQIRGSSSLTLNLPDLDLVPENSTFIFEGIINTTRQHLIQTSSAQYIYINGESVDHIWIGKGEKFELFRDVDGWYVIDGGHHYLDIGVPKHVYKAGLNEINLTGQEVDREAYPRLFEVIQGFGGGYVSDSVWNTASSTITGEVVPFPYRGCYSSGSVSTKFRLPNFLNSAVRGLKNIGGTDTARVHNSPGGFQKHLFESHSHPVKPPDSDSDSGWGKTATGGVQAEQGGITTYLTGATGGSETRMDNIGLIFVTKY